MRRVKRCLSVGDAAVGLVYAAASCLCLLWNRFTFAVSPAGSRGVVVCAGDVAR